LHKRLRLKIITQETETQGLELDKVTQGPIGASKSLCPRARESTVSTRAKSAAAPAGLRPARSTHTQWDKALVCMETSCMLFIC